MPPPETQVSPPIVDGAAKKILKLEKDLANLEKNNQDMTEEKTRLETELGVLRQIPHPTKIGKTLQDEVNDFLYGQ